MPMPVPVPVSVPRSRFASGFRSRRFCRRRFCILHFALCTSLEPNRTESRPALFSIALLLELEPGGTQLSGVPGTTMRRRRRRRTAQLPRDAHDARPARNGVHKGQTEPGVVRPSSQDAAMKHGNPEVRSFAEGLIRCARTSA